MGMINELKLSNATVFSINIEYYLGKRLQKRTKRNSINVWIFGVGEINPVAMECWGGTSQRRGFRGL